MKNNWIEKLRKQDACEEAIDWASEQATPQAAWSACERGDWMLWAWSRNYGKIGSKSHRRLVLCAAECAKTSVKYIENKEVKKLAKKSLETTERWARGEEGVTLEDVKNAGKTVAACYDTYAAYAAKAVVVSYATTDAAGYAAWDAADAALYAADAAAAYSIAREKTLKECADIIRTLQPDCPKFKKVTG